MTICELRFGYVGLMFGVNVVRGIDLWLRRRCLMMTRKSA